MSSTFYLSDQLVFCWEEDLHPGSVSVSDAELDGTDTFTYTVYEDSITISIYVPQTTWSCTQHTTETHP